MSSANSHTSIGELPPERWQEYRRFRLEALQNEPNAYTSEYQIEAAKTDAYWQEKFKNNTDGQGGIMLFAFDEDRIVGMTGAYWSSTKRIRHVGNVSAVYVTEAFRKQGIATRLLTALIEQMKTRHGIEKVQLTVTATQDAAHRMYLGLGFHDVGLLERELKTDTGYLDVYFMEKLL